MLLNDYTYRIVLFGHRDFDGHRELRERLHPLLVEKIRSKPYVEIYIGRNGEFDNYAASLVKGIQNSIGKENVELICVLPYPEKDIEYYEEYYDSVIIPECVEKTHPKGAIEKRNKWMVEQADYVIAYIAHDFGGAYQTYKHAKSKNKPIFNLTDKEF